MLSATGNHRTAHLGPRRRRTSRVAPRRRWPRSMIRRASWGLVAKSVSWGIPAAWQRAGIPQVRELRQVEFAVDQRVPADAA